MGVDAKASFVCSFESWNYEKIDTRARPHTHHFILADHKAILYGISRFFIWNITLW